MPLPKPRMESPQCSNMKPMTIQQGAIYHKYRINHDARNEHNLKVWRQLYAETELAIAILKDHFSRGARPDADT